MRRNQLKRPARPLIVTTDQDLLDDLLRICAGVEAEADVAQDLIGARSGYHLAPLVLLGADVAVEGLPVHLPRRAGVVVASRVYNDAQAWDLAFDLGAEHVAALPMAESWLRERLTTALRTKVGGGKIVAIVGGRGGAGASVLAAGLAVTAVRQGLRALLVDADPLGGGIDLLFGWEQEHGLRWPQLAETGGQFDTETLVNALPNRGDLVLLSCDRSESTPGDPAPKLLPDLMQVVLDAGREGRDLVVVDLPRRFDEAAQWALRTADRALIVVTPGIRATSAAARVANAVMAYRSELSLVVRGVAPGRPSATEISKKLAVPLIGRMRSEPRLIDAIEKGDPPAANPRGPLATLCQSLLEEAMA